MEQIGEIDDTDAFSKLKFSDTAALPDPVPGLSENKTEYAQGNNVMLIAVLQVCCTHAYARLA